MDVKLPDGTVIQNVPDGMTKAQLVTKLQANGMHVPASWLPAPAGAPFANSVPTMQADGTGAVPPVQGAPSPADPTAATQSALSKLRDIYQGGVTGPLESAAAMASGAILQPVSGIAGLGQMANNAITGSTTDPADVVKQVQGMAYQPRTQAGIDTTQAAGAVGALPGKALKAAGLTGSDAADATGSPLYGALTDAAMGAAPTALGMKLPGMGAAKLADAEATAVATGPKQAARAQAAAAGYHLLPDEVPDAPLGRTLSGIAGPDQQKAATSLVNQHVTNTIGKVDLGLPVSEPLTPAAVAKRGAVADEGYQKVRTADQNIVMLKDAQGNPITNAAGKPMAGPAGPMKPDPAYDADVQNIGADRKNTVLGENPEVVALRNKLAGAQGAVKPNDAVSSVNQLRSDARANLNASDDPSKLALGRAQMQAADAMEDRLSRYLQNTGQSSLYNQFTDARTLKAKVNTYQANMNKATGDIDASGMSADRENGVYMEGGAKTIADAADALSRTVKNTDKVQMPPPISALDYVVKTGGLAGGALAGGSAVGGHAAGLGAGAVTLASLLARPAARGFLNSKLYQNNLVNDIKSPAAGALATLAAKPGSPLAGLLMAPGSEPVDQ